MQTVESRFIAVVSIIYLVGIIGFMIPELNPLFIKLTPWNLVLSFGVAWLFHKKWEITHILGIVIIGILGFFIELLGVKTGIIFGSYNYGATLGSKWQGVPFLIGLNWASMVFYSSSILAGRIKNTFGKSLVGATMMTAYDFFLEPVAVRFDFWHWNTNEIPLQNYITWFICSFLFFLLLDGLSKPIRNRMAGSMFWIQMGFFIVLYILIRLF